MNVIANYKNGDYRIIIFDDGTKIRTNDLEGFHPEIPESMDLKITDFCDMDCPMCHEKSSTKGTHADILHLPFFDSLHPGMEIAIGGGNPLSHPDILPFLELCKSKGLIASMTVNQKHYMDNESLLTEWHDKGLIHGIGVSLRDPVSLLRTTNIRDQKDAVIHVIAGYHSLDNIKGLANQGLKILILGYKTIGRGLSFYMTYNKEVRRKILDLKKYIKECHDNNVMEFKTISFDNLALDQLGIKDILTKEEWDSSFMGDDGFATMYIDAVKGQFARSSTSREHERHEWNDDIVEMFKEIQKKE